MGNHVGQLIELLAPLEHDGFRGAEIGVYKGQLAGSLLEHFKTLHLIMVDSWHAAEKGGGYWRSGDGCSRLSQEQQESNYQESVIRTEFARDRAQIIRNTSAAASSEVAQRSLDFVFIDADHTYSAVKNDILCWKDKVRPGGMLCGHDYDSPRDRRGIWGVRRAVDEFATAMRFDVAIGRGHVWSIIL